MTSDNQTLKRMGPWLAVLGLAGCWLPIPTMIMPDQLELTGDVYEVSGASGSFLPSLFTQHIRFGPYVAGVKTSGDSGAGSGPTIFNGGKETMEWSERAWFTMQGGEGGTWRGTCIRKDRTVTQHESSLEIGRHGIRTDDHPHIIEDRHEELCDLQSPDGRFMKVELSLWEAAVASGMVRSRFGEWQFTPSNEQRDQPFGHVTAGFVFRDEAGATVAALDTGGRKRLALKHGLEGPQRDLVAALSVTILLQRFL